MKAALIYGTEIYVIFTYNNDELNSTDHDPKLLNYIVSLLRFADGGAQTFQSHS